MPNIIIKSYEHVNRSFSKWDTPNGRYIRNKDEYDRAMKEEGMITYEQMQQKAGEKKDKDYILSKKAHAIIQSAKNSKDRRGNVKLSDKTVEAMKEIGAIGKKIPNYVGIPNQSKEGGFYSI